MPFSAELSLYPLANNYIEVIQAFIDRLNEYPDLTVLTNTMSTQIFGDYDTVMQALQRCMRWSMEHYGKLVFVCKFIPGDLRP